MATTAFDFIIIGGGISGLVLSWKLEQKYPQAKILILEKQSKIGGRLKMAYFQGHHVVTGAGICRALKDHRLINLMKEVGMKVAPIQTSITEAPIPCSILEIVKELKTKPFDRSKEDFETFYQRNRDDLDEFTLCVGYTDYLKADIVDTLYDYGFDDCLKRLKIIPMNWDELVDRVAGKLKKTTILCDSDVLEVHPEQKTVQTKEGKHYKFRKSVIYATTKSGLESLCGMDTFFYQQAKNVQAQPFIRIYTKTNLPLSDHAQKVSTPLQKIIPIDSKQHIYMIAYADNKNAKILYHGKSFENFLPRPDVEILDYQKFYHKEGTHYYRPLPSFWKSRDLYVEYMQHPHGNVWIVGEMISMDQGWTEGALDSIERIIGKI